MTYLSPAFQAVADRRPQSPLIEDRLGWFDELRAAAANPVDKAFIGIELAFTTWATVHDTTERLVGDGPDWWRHD